mmetsp:Transcript_27311/g.24192  ORF Transcript_27311/g.24192 Transcript_27311/m.24192 type:complete len:132 (+) Transcript_27311:64-459(+)
MFQRIEITLFILEYYGFCHEGVRLWKQLNKFTRYQVEENELYFQNFISQRKTLILQNFDSKSIHFALHWMKYLNLKIYSFTSTTQSSFFSFLKSLDSPSPTNNSIKNLKIIDLQIMSKIDNSADLISLLLK